MGYTELKKIYRETRVDYFNMAICHLMNIGFLNAEKITDEEIASVEGNGLMTKEFCEWIMKTAREIAKVSNLVELIQLCMAEDIYAPAEGLSNDRLKKLVCTFIDLDIRPLKGLVRDGIMEPEDLEALGYWTEKDVEEYYEEEE